MGLLVLLMVGFCFFLAFVGGAIGMPMPVPHEYGSVIIHNFSGQAGLAAVRFDHWLHRARYTCRLCHVDIGFAMEANATKIEADTNMKGFYCGSCHNGTRVYGSKKIFAACSLSPRPGEDTRCSRCHSVGKKVQKEYDYASFTKGLPKKNLLNLVDWEDAEARGFIRPIDFLPGVSMERPPLTLQKDFSIPSKGWGWMSDIIFSHKKHARWNGCEVCHPDIFPSVKRGTVKYSMLEIWNGQYCGVCHSRVAFPLNDCQRCHVNRVRR
ncbi:MAG TPA: c(7)-type cytochrome triheme domain-containing protein [Thermodesulfobacteriota bacterium]|nr:c(7)-type cytochrome triheme domain-containing protein [Thermodesulfobacteriota bacterium]